MVTPVALSETDRYNIRTRLADCGGTIKGASAKGNVHIRASTRIMSGIAVREKTILDFLKGVSLEEQAQQERSAKLSLLAQGKLPEPATL